MQKLTLTDCSTTFLFYEADMLNFCPITHLLALAFADDAFEAPSLKSTQYIFKLFIPKPLSCVKLEWKEEKRKIPLFRQAVRSTDGFVTCSSQALRYSAFNHYIERLGCLTGFEKQLGGYCTRRATGNAVDVT